ncbi:MAG: virulence factor SrfC family protein [Acetobacteraceae bacterium]|nr:virulence factor SrfC family protein [Acetobacteraceae bacterium]
MMLDALSAEDGLLAERCAAAAEAIADGIAWIEAHPEIAREAGPAVVRDLRRFAARGRRLAAAAARPMCVAVFGPSQAGKSYLISALARKGTDPVRVVLGERAVDFVAEINPEGGKEATGLVTRFTVRPTPGLPGKPVAVRLLTQGDVVKILGNSFLEDFNRDAVQPLAPQKVATLLDSLRSRAGRTAAAAMGEESVFDLAEYFDRYFRGHPVILSLGQGFWREAAALAPGLSAADRARLFSVLWNAIPAYTETCRRLGEALEALGDPDEAFLGLDALLPRETSIIDVETLAGLGSPDRAASLEVATRDGRRAVLPRAVVAALTAELRLTLADQPWAFFSATDLLDFPGARSREVLSDAEGYLADPARVAPLYLRGKVAYLYQRYVAEQELTAMLLCIGPSNQEVRTLPGMVKEWVDATHGPTPEERARQPTSLFLVLTKFDMEFEEKRGRREDRATASRWATRIEASITRFLGLEHAWPTEWTPGRPFANTFWLRNPNVLAKAILDYDAEGREVAVREPERLARLKAEFLATPEVQRHFADPERAWDEAMRLNDGGITYLAESLAPVCNPALKRGQVAARLARLARDAAARLDPFHVSDDREAERKKRRAEGAALARHLAACLEKQRFGLLLRALMVEAEALQTAFTRLVLHAPAEDPLAAPVLGAAAKASDLADELAGLFGEEAAAPQPQAEGRGATTDLADQFAETAVAEWQERLRAFAADPATASFLLIPRENAAFLAAQLAAGAAWQDLRGRIAAAIRAKASYRERFAEALVKPVMIAERMINDYVAALGFDRLPEAERPRTPREGRIVFRPREAAEDWPALGEQPSPFERDYAVDWITALARLIDRNVDHAFGGGIDSEANARLGRILSRLAEAA